jgi:hypothetical protein
VAALTAAKIVATARAKASKVAVQLTAAGEVSLGRWTLARELGLNYWPDMDQDAAMLWGEIRALRGRWPMVAAPWEN